MTQPTKSKVPKIRFKGFRGGWEETPIGEVLTEKKRPIKLEDHQQYELITVKRRNEGIVSRGRLFGREILVKNYSQLEAGDFVISKRQVVHGATGIIPALLDGAIVSNEYLVAVENSRITTDFLTILASLPDMRRKFFLSSYGVDIEKLFFDAEDWKSRGVTIPSPAEQTQIGGYFREVDRLIGLQQRKHDKLVTLKKAMLHAMFPQPGETTPKIRFKGFEGDWNRKRLGELGDTYNGLYGKTRAAFGHGAGRFVTYMNVFSNAIADENMVECVELDSSQNQVEFGDVLFTTSSETPEEVGMSSVWTAHTANVYFNSFCFGFRPKVTLNHLFLAYALRAYAFRKSISFLAQGISRYNISKRKTMELGIGLPSSEEQQKIGRYFRTLDELISKHALQLRKLKQLKAACLEKMFV